MFIIGGKTTQYGQELHCDLSKLLSADWIMDTQVHFGHQLKHLESQCMDDNARWLLNHNTSCKFQKVICVVSSSQRFAILQALHKEHHILLNFLKIEILGGNINVDWDGVECDQLQDGGHCYHGVFMPLG